MKQNKRCPDCSSDNKSKRLEVMSTTINWPGGGRLERKLCQGSWHMTRKSAKQ